jgi:hypothetical protein
VTTEVICRASTERCETCAGIPADARFLSTVSQGKDALLLRRLLSSLNMDPAQLTRSQKTRCDGCTRITPSCDIVNYGCIESGHRQLCSQCFNKKWRKQ